MSSHLEGSNHTNIYEPNTKSFGLLAERLNRDEFNLAVIEIINKCSEYFPDVEMIIPLEDKVSFGDIDIVILSDTPPELDDETRMREIFGESLLGYKHTKNNKMDSTLIKLSTGKVVQVDFMRTKDSEEFLAKLIHASKGHSSSVIGTLARAYGFKYSIDGFYKRFTATSGQDHDILVTKDLFLAMKLLGLDPEKWKVAKTVDDIIEFIASSEFFNPVFFSRSLNHKQKNNLALRSIQRFMYSELASKESTNEDIDFEKYLQTTHPQVFQSYKAAELKIENQNKVLPNLSGATIMHEFKLKSGAEVGSILTYLKDKYPNLEAITPEIIEDVATNHFSIISDHTQN